VYNFSQRNFLLRPAGVAIRAVHFADFVFADVIGEFQRVKNHDDALRVGQAHSRNFLVAGLAAMCSTVLPLLHTFDRATHSDSELHESVRLLHSRRVHRLSHFF
jgi:hypothetical protein